MVTTVDRVDGEDIVGLEETGTFIHMTEIEPATTPHVHAELIHEWADDPSIQYQYLLSGQDNWHECGGQPCWYTDTQYRRKPAKPPQALEKEAIVKEMEDLKQRLEALEIEPN